MAKMTDYEYQDRRNRLIPQAEAIADNFTADIKDKVDFDLYAKRWNKVFFGTMDKLAKEAGLLS